MQPRYSINGIKSTGSWNLICILYTQGVRYTRCYAYVNISSAGKFSRDILAFIRPVIPRPRAPTAYNRINAVIRTSLQCNSLALQSSKVFTPSCLRLFYLQNIIFTGTGSRWDCFQKIYIWCSAARRVSLCKKIIVWRKGVLQRCRSFDAPFKLHPPRFVATSAFTHNNSVRCVTKSLSEWIVLHCALKWNYSTDSIISFVIPLARNQNNVNTFSLKAEFKYGFCVQMQVYTMPWIIRIACLFRRV